MRIPSIVCAMLVASTAASGQTLVGPDRSAEAEDPTPPGTLVRITTAGPRMKGLVLASDAQSLTIVVEGSRTPTPIPRSAIHRIDVGSRRSVADGAARGACRGFLIGGAAGLVIGTIAGGGNEDSAAMNAVLSSVVTGMFSALVGGAIGAAVPGQSWKPVTSTPRATARPTPRADGVRVAVSLSF